MKLRNYTCGRPPRPWRGRFWEKVDKTETCWNWTAALSRDGYARFNNATGTESAARFLWAKLNGPIPQGMLVMHKCDNPKCVRPDHLKLGTPRDNVTDALNKGRMTRGERSHRAVLTADMVAQIRVEYARGTVTMKALGAKYGISRTGIDKVVSRKAWRWL